MLLSEAQKVLVGSAEATKIYLGANEVWNPGGGGPTAYRYFKITWTNNWGGTLVGMSVLWICNALGVKYNDQTMAHTYNGPQVNGTPAEMSNTVETDYWQLNNSGYPHWWKVDLGVGNAQIAYILKTRSYYLDANRNFKNFTLEGSNDNVNFDLLYTGITAHSALLQTFVIIP